MPLYILLLIMSWFTLVRCSAFSLLIWSSQAEHSLLQAFVAAAASTLGFLTPPGVSGQLLLIPEGAGWARDRRILLHLHPWL